VDAHRLAGLRASVWTDAARVSLCDVVDSFVSSCLVVYVSHVLPETTSGVSALWNCDFSILGEGEMRSENVSFALQGY
jgi:hypothetical protein